MTKELAMNAEAVVQQQVGSNRSPRTALLVVLALVLGGCVGAGVVALTSDGTSDSGDATVRPVTLPAEGVTTCPGDGGALLAGLVSLPIDVSNDIMTRLSPTTRALVVSAVEQSAITRTRPEVPDAATLSAAIARVGPRDAAVLMGGLAPQTRTAVGAPRGSTCR
jgi:hypothetical protein